jgi:thiol-disulfide isomerase/thioredoxin
MIATALFTILVQAPKLELHLVPSGTFERVGGYRPYVMPTSPTAPDSLSLPASLPSGLEYGVLKFGSGSSEKKYSVAIEEPVSADSRIFVDEKADGNLTESPPFKWKARQFKTSDGTEKTSYSATISIDLPYQGTTVPCSVGIYLIDSSRVGYYGDFSLQGTATLKGVSYDAIYWDSTAHWDPQTADGTLMVDTDHDGKFHPGYEFFNPNQPFNIKGTTFDLKSMDGALAMVASKKWVKERTLADIPADPNLSNGLRPGKTAPIFAGMTLDGTTVSFPHSYAGKVVMLDFWATWCGPCMREAPNVAAVYAKYHSQGLEVLGVSLDNPNAKDAISKTTAHVGMIWPQIYDGKAWSGDLVKEYGIKAIPATYLVDGDSGKIIAMLSQLRGPELEQTVKKALASKHG